MIGEAMSGPKGRGGMAFALLSRLNVKWGRGASNVS